MELFYYVVDNKIPISFIGFSLVILIALLDGITWIITRVTNKDKAKDYKFKGFEIACGIATLFVINIFVDGFILLIPFLGVFLILKDKYK